MIISQIIGGLGNQMFQYAVARSLALDKGLTLKLDISAYKDYRLHQGYELSRIFACQTELANAKDLQSILGITHSSLVRKILRRSMMKSFRPNSFVIEPYFHYWSGISDISSGVYLEGYWQSERYFKKHEQQVRNDFLFKLPLEGKNLSFAQNLGQGNDVSVHIRRGDYVTNPNANKVHGTCSMEYYQSAINYIMQNIESPILYIFSDDPQWVRENIKLKIRHEFIDHNRGSESFNDMRLMSMCSHHIIANSSFSWWGAWLNPNQNKIVVAPKKWFEIKLNTKDLYPRGWVQL